MPIMTVLHFIPESMAVAVVAVLLVLLFIGFLFAFFGKDFSITSGGDAKTRFVTLKWRKSSRH